MRYQIRPMTEKDIPDVIRGEEEIFKTSLGFDLLYTDLTLNPYAYYFVLEINKKVKGYIGLWIEDTAQIVNFYVDKDIQNQGYGTMIMDFVINLCEMSGVASISLEVRVSNSKAIHLYEKYGFKNSHIRPQYYEDLEDAMVMIKYFKEEQ